MVRSLIGLTLAFGIFMPLAAAETGNSPASNEADTTSSPATEVQSRLDRVQTLVRAQAQQLESQRQQIERQQLAIEELRREMTNRWSGQSSAEEQEQAAASTAARLNAEVHALNTPEVPTSEAALETPALVAKRAQSTDAKSLDAPRSIHFGNASLTPGGWVDFTAYYRSTDVGSGLGTSFASIPFNSTVTGGLSETHFTAQSSRITLRADEAFGATKVFGYAEADFNGYLPSNAYVSTNSDTLRLRVYFTDLSRKRWDLLGGQSWSLLTPNRVGVSPFLSEIYNTLHLDTNYQVGLTYARQAQLRAVYHFTNHVALGLSAENPEQFSGSAATFPTLFSNTETDVNSGTGSGGGTATPNLHPDIVAKLSADAGWGGRNWHFETAGLLTSVAILTPASVTKTISFKDDREGGGISGVANVAAVKNLHLILTGFWSDGGGRYHRRPGAGLCRRAEWLEDRAVYRATGSLRLRDRSRRSGRQPDRPVLSPTIAGPTSTACFPPIRAPERWWATASRGVRTTTIARSGRNLRHPDHALEAGRLWLRADSYAKLLHHQEPMVCGSRYAEKCPCLCGIREPALCTSMISKAPVAKRLARRSQET